MLTGRSKSLWWPRVYGRIVGDSELWFVISQTVSRIRLLISSCPQSSNTSCHFCVSCQSKKSRINVEVNVFIGSGRISMGRKFHALACDIWNLKVAVYTLCEIHILYVAFWSVIVTLYMSMSSAWLINDLARYVRPAFMFRSFSAKTAIISLNKWTG
jgi:hypothetical protein